MTGLLTRAERDGENSCSRLAWPWRHFKTNKRILKSTWNRTGGRWSESKIGVMCSCFFMHVKRRAAAFWTTCSRDDWISQHKVHCNNWNRLKHGLSSLGDVEREWFSFGDLSQLKKAGFDYWAELRSSAIILWIGSSVFHFLQYNTGRGLAKPATDFITY